MNTYYMVQVRYVGYRKWRRRGEYAVLREALRRADAIDEYAHYTPNPGDCHIRIWRAAPRRVMRIVRQWLPDGTRII